MAHGVTRDSSIDLAACNSQVQTTEESFSFSMTDAKIKRYALFAFSAIATVGSCALVGAVISGSVSFPFLLVTVPLLFFATQFYNNGCLIKDYEDPQEIAQMKESAEKMSFSEIRKEHRGVKKVLQYEIVPLAILQEKFKTEFESLKLSEIFEKQNLSLSYVVNNELMNPRDLAAKFKEELQSLEDLDAAYQKFPPKDLDLLLEAGGIKRTQRDTLESLYQKKQKCCNDLKTKLLKLDSTYAGRKDRILESLDSRLRLLQNKPKISVLSEEKPIEAPTSLLGDSALETLQRIELEKNRIEKDNIGADLQRDYLSKKDDLETDFSSVEVGIEGDFTFFKQDFARFR